MASVDAEFHTNGAGGYIALGAMDRGASAIEAIESAIRWSTDCGGPIQVERLASFGPAAVCVGINEGLVNWRAESERAA
jgi:hypothetical protein